MRMLYEITGEFSHEKLLGEGGFRCVFKGTLGDDREVAVKQLKGGGGQGEREFQAKVEIISRVHHRHLVSLIGYRISEDHRLLVYDFVANDTMHHNLHGRVRPVMDWPTRVKIAAGSARGLAYLHEDSLSLPGTAASWSTPVLPSSRNLGILTGSFGEILKAYWRGTPIVVRRILPSLSDDMPVIQDFKHEVNLLIKLRHPNIVQILGAVTETKPLMLVTEFLR